MALAVISHHADPNAGIARLSYQQIGEMASLSRAKLAAGLDVLEAHGVVERAAAGRGSYRLIGYDPRLGWAKFPTAGDDFHLRRRAGLDAVKLLFLIAARRDRRINAAKMTHQTIEEYSGVAREHIRRGLTILAVAGILHVDRVRSNAGAEQVANSYRLAHIDPYPACGHGRPLRRSRPRRSGRRRSRQVKHGATGMAARVAPDGLLLRSLPPTAPSAPSPTASSRAPPGARRVCVAWRRADQN
jgi:DNA-binding Lrp family transcriptional regulator